MVLVFWALPCTAQPIESRTNGMFNGRGWTATAGHNGDLVRFAFLVGYFDAAQSTAWIEGDKKAFARLPIAVTYEEAASFLDRFYRAPENLRFPVTFVLKIFALTTAGTNQADIDETVTEMRRFLNTVEDGQIKPPPANWKPALDLTPKH